MLPIEWQNFRRILVIRLDNIGDVVMLSPALRTLHSHLPNASITLMASPAGSLKIDPVARKDQQTLKKEYQASKVNKINLMEVS